MRLSFIEVCGFRGFRDRLRLEIPRGFAILSGRNGVGKSTICDAVEYAITGDLSRYRVDKSGGEQIATYMWWMGDGAAEAHYVSVGFISDDGETFTITRRREKGLDGATEDQIHALLCAPAGAPEQALVQLCRTSIIRDELIARMSLELSDIERFTFVSNAIGAVNATKHLSRAQDLIRTAKAEEEAASKEYERQRDRVGPLLEDLSRIRTSMARAGDVSTAIETLHRVVGVEVTKDLDLTVLRQQYAASRAKFAELRRVANEMDAIQPLLMEVSSEAFGALLAGCAATKADLTVQIAALDEQLATALREADQEQRVNEMAAALASVALAGHQLGLLNGHCPLCNTALSSEDFELGVRAANARLSAISEALMESWARVENLRSKKAAVVARLESLNADIAAHIKRRIDAESRARELLAEAARAGLEVESVTEVPPLRAAVEEMADRLAAAEQAFQTIQIAQSSSGIDDLEARVGEARTYSNDAERTLGRARRSKQIAHDIDFAVRRTAHEIVEDRLSSISPLLSELYQRLKPHRDWRIEYRLRGDVRRFLRLSVGKDLDPQYLFSSGQRRAAGIAFLLSVYLSRTWTRWKTLILDDPVQHIDDYRALNLVEVLSALRRDGSQIICAVEDEALADLLSRRLRSSIASPGVRYDLALDSSGQPVVKRSDSIATFPVDAFITALNDQPQNVANG